MISYSIYYRHYQFEILFHYELYEFFVEFFTTNYEFHERTLTQRSPTFLNPGYLWNPDTGWWAPLHNGCHRRRSQRKPKCKGEER